MSYHTDLARNLDRIEREVDEARENLSVLTDDEQPSLTRDELENRLNALEDEAERLADLPVASMQAAISELVSNIQALYSDV
jgi:hypothetical protein